MNLTLNLTVLETPFFATFTVANVPVALVIVVSLVRSTTSLSYYSALQNSFESCTETSFSGNGVFYDIHRRKGSRGARRCRVCTIDYITSIVFRDSR